MNSKALEMIPIIASIWELPSQTKQEFLYANDLIMSNVSFRGNNVYASFA